MVLVWVGLWFGYELWFWFGLWFGLWFGFGMADTLQTGVAGFGVALGTDLASRLGSCCFSCFLMLSLARSVFCWVPSKRASGVRRLILGLQAQAHQCLCLGLGVLQ